MILDCKKCSKPRHNYLSNFIISQEYYGLPKRTIRSNGNIYHIFKPNNLRDVQNFYKDKASMDITLNEFKYLTTTCWDKKNHLLTIDMTEDKYTGRDRLCFKNLVVPDSSPFYLTK